MYMCVRTLGWNALTMQRLISLHNLRHEHWPLPGDGGQRAEGGGEVDAGDGWMDHELQQPLQGTFPLLAQHLCSYKRQWVFFLDDENVFVFPTCEKGDQKNQQKK